MLKVKFKSFSYMLSIIYPSIISSKDIVDVVVPPMYSGGGVQKMGVEITLLNPSGFGSFPPVSCLTLFQKCQLLQCCVFQQQSS